MYNITIGMDLGDKNHILCVLDQNGTSCYQGSIPNKQETVKEFFLQYPRATVAIEAGTHSPWISRLLEDQGCHVLVGNPRRLRAIWDSERKDDYRDAEMLARIARFDPELLYPINHRGQQAQVDLELLQARDMLVKARTSLINHVRGSVKAFGERVRSCSAACFHRKAEKDLPDVLKPVLLPILEMIEQLSNQIKSYDKTIEDLCCNAYPETELLMGIKGVGALTALAFILVLEDPSRFDRSRQVGSFLGLTPRRDQSGATDKQLRITKAGNPYLRRLLVGAAQYILGPFGEDCNLKRFGKRLCDRGGKNGKKRAVVAVARKLAVLLHHLWRTGTIYDPLYKPSGTLAKAA
ncbi:IS110 family transposase [Thermodesulfobacteriota bacterium B35]